MTTKRSFFSFIFFILLVQGGLSYGHTDWQFVRVPKAEVTEAWVAETNFIRDHLADREYVFGYLEHSKLESLSSKERKNIVVLDAKAWATEAHDPKTMQALPTWDVPEEPYEEYHTYATLTAEPKALAAKFPQLVTLHSAGKSVEGRDLWYVVLTSKKIAAPKPKLLYISSMHGDEVTGKEMMVYLIRDLLASYGTGTRQTALLDYGELYIMPSMNPDGTEKGVRFNANGVDLNRDFPHMNEEAYSTEGRAIETLALMELHRKHHFVLSMNFHGGALCINIPWDHKANVPGSLFGDNTLMYALAREYTQLNAPMYQTHGDSFDHGVTYGFEWYLVLGGMQDWSIHFRQSTHATLEISGIKWPSATQLPSFWRHNQDALMTYLERGLEGVHLKVVDEKGAVVTADVGINSATRNIRYEGGYVHRPTIPAQQKVTIQAAGYETATLVTEPSPFRGEFQTVVLKTTK